MQIWDENFSLSARAVGLAKELKKGKHLHFNVKLPLEANNRKYADHCNSVLPRDEIAGMACLLEGKYLHFNANQRVVYWSEYL